MLVRVRRFGVLRTATVAAAVYFVIALVFTLFFVIVALASPPTSTLPGSALGPGATAFSFDARPMLIVFAIIIPILYGVIGWVFTAIACLLYNLVARFIGGVEIELTPLGQPGIPIQPGTQAGPGVAAG